MTRKSIEGAAESAAWSVTVPLHALRIGLWEDDVAADRIRGDAMFARLFGLPADELAAGITRSHLLSLFHPDDAVQDPELRHGVREAGGLFVWEHRIVPEPGVVRWMLARGHFERGADGRMRGRGIVVDVTDARADDDAGRPARFLDAPDGAVPVVERMADHALRLLELVGGLDAAGAGELRPRIEGLLHEIGRRIAASLSDPAAPRPPPRRAPGLH